MEAIRLTFMEKDDIGEAAAVLGEAMGDNPLHVAVFPGDAAERRREVETMFTGLLMALPEIVLVAREAGTIVGVMRMKSCTGFKPQTDTDEADGENDPQQRKRIWHAEWARHEPHGQHWHLGPIGVLPSPQGKGVGSQLMRRFCAEVDACGSEACLETDLDANVCFYEQFGFNVAAESEILGVASRYMLRPARLR